MKEEDFRRIVREELLRIFPHQEFLEMLNNEVDTVKLFFDKFKYVSSSNKMLIPIIYADYKDFCIDSNIVFLDKSNFITSLKEKNIKVSRINIGNVAYVEKL